MGASKRTILYYVTILKYGRWPKSTKNIDKIQDPINRQILKGEEKGTSCHVPEKTVFIRFKIHTHLASMIDLERHHQRYNQLGLQPTIGLLSNLSNLIKRYR